MKTLVIIPAFNESGSLRALVNNIRKYAPDFDILVVNDCSKDETLALCRQLRVGVLDLSFNLGIGGAVQTGYRYAFQHQYDIAVQVDGDGQHDPRFLQLLIAPIVDKRCDMTIGSRFLEGKGFQSTQARRMGIKFFSWLIYFIAQKQITDATSGFRAGNRNIIRCFAESYPRDYPEPESIVSLCRLGFTIQEVPVVMKERETGTSSINHLKSIYYMTKVTMAILIDRLKCP